MYDNDGNRTFGSDPAAEIGGPEWREQYPLPGNGEADGWRYCRGDLEPEENGHVPTDALGADGDVLFADGEVHPARGEGLSRWAWGFDVAPGDPWPDSGLIVAYRVRPLQLELQVSFNDEED